MNVSVIMPAYNEEEAIHLVIRGIRGQYPDDQDVEILVIDDGSTDATAQVAENAGARVISHPYNMGNGAAVKTGIRHATGQHLVMMDADGQHNPQDIPRLLQKLDRYHMIVGARSRQSDTALHRDLANSAYNLFASYVCSRKIKDLTSGFRAIRADIAQDLVYLLPNTFSYPTTLTLAIVHSGYSLAYISIDTAKRLGRSKIKLFEDGSRFLLIMLRIATSYAPLKVFIPASIFLFLLGLGYGAFKVLVLGMRYGPTAALLMTMSMLVLLIGLVSEQITLLRMQRPK